MLFQIVISGAILTMSILFHTSVLVAGAPYEGYYRYLYEDGGDYPTAWTETRYSNMFSALSHDEDNWYMAQSGCKDTFWGDKCERKLWRIPLEVNLNTNTSEWWEDNDPFPPISITPPGVKVMDLPDIRNNDFKLLYIYDLAFYRYGGRGYLFARAKMETISTGIEGWGLAVIDSDTFELIDVSPSAGVCIATKQDGRLVTVGLDETDIPSIIIATLDWHALATNGQLLLSFPNAQGTDIIPIYLSDGRTLGQPPINCDLSPSGELIYMNVAVIPQHRIFVASTITGTVEEISTNSALGEDGYFNIWAMPDPNSADAEYIEGLTIWDLDADQRAPGGIRGKLHVGVVNYDNWELSITDDIRISHFSELIYLDSSSTSQPERGTWGHPYNSLPDAAAGASNRSIMYIRPGDYSGGAGRAVLDKKMKIIPLTAPGTSIILGQ